MCTLLPASIWSSCVVSMSSGFSIIPKVDGEVLTGKVEDAANGAVANIENGTFKDGAYSYDVTIKTAVGEMTNHLSGKFDGEKLVGKSANPMGEFDADAVRV